MCVFATRTSRFDQQLSTERPIEFAQFAQLARRRHSDASAGQTVASRALDDPGRDSHGHGNDEQSAGGHHERTQR